MGFSEYSRTNEKNLKLREFYKRYFIWGSKESSKIDYSKKIIETGDPVELKKHLKQANNIRIRKTGIIVLIFLLLVLLVAILVNFL